MITQTNGKIFLAAERGHNELSWYRSYNTFKFGQYQNQHKEAVGALYVLNDDTLAPGGSTRMSVEEDSQVVLLPLAGALTFMDSLDNTDTLQPGEAQLLNIPGAPPYASATLPNTIWLTFCRYGLNTLQM